MITNKDDFGGMRLKCSQTRAVIEVGDVISWSFHELTQLGKIFTSPKTVSLLGIVVNEIVSKHTIDPWLIPHVLLSDGRLITLHSDDEVKLIQKGPDSNSGPRRPA